MSRKSSKKFEYIKGLVNLFAEYSILLECAEKNGLEVSIEAEVLYTRDTAENPSLKSLLEKYRKLAGIKMTHPTLNDYPGTEFAKEPYSSISSAQAEGKQIHPELTVAEFLGKLNGITKNYYNSQYPKMAPIPEMPEDVAHFLAKSKQFRVNIGRIELIDLADCKIKYDIEKEYLRVNESGAEFKGTMGATILDFMFQKSMNEYATYEELAEALELNHLGKDRQKVHRKIRNAVDRINEKVRREVPTNDELIRLTNTTFFRKFGTKNL